MTVFKRDFTDNVYRLMGHFDFFKKYFYEVFLYI